MFLLWPFNPLTLSFVFHFYHCLLYHPLKMASGRRRNASSNCKIVKLKNLAKPFRNLKNFEELNLAWMLPFVLITIQKYFLGPLETKSHHIVQIVLLCSKSENPHQVKVKWAFDQMSSLFEILDPSIQRIKQVPQDPNSPAINLCLFSTVQLVCTFSLTFLFKYIGHVWQK